MSPDKLTVFNSLQEFYEKSIRQKEREQEKAAMEVAAAEKERMEKFG